MPIDGARLTRRQQALDARATERSRAFWQKYLKGSANFRGVPMSDVREVVLAWWRLEGLSALDPRAQLSAALSEGTGQVRIPK